MTPLTTNDIVVCPHNGQVVLKSNNGKSLSIKDSAKAITKNDLLNADIVGCTRTIAGTSVPCVKVVSVESTSKLLSVNNDEVVLCEKLNLSLTDKGFPLALQGNPNAKEWIAIEDKS
ncbi:hypothetical protein [Helicobacter sp. MIT 05-5294]|uniref:hypothetical protein n=1 Tax=Helicobacter sp. MIT 05-5294 TaxID=1548150 RepID=UPI00051FF3C9|nr:hypothetical protein [Helicobacter sp. MIT 05-5294]TLD85734.1 hypothetical protein LS69_008005 [Helicobacter sp. MIT 05-5294]